MSDKKIIPVTPWFTKYVEEHNCEPSFEMILQHWGYNVDMKPLGDQQFKPKLDCFAYGHDIKTNTTRCRALKETYCLYNEECHFFKSKQQFDEETEAAKKEEP